MTGIPAFLAPRRNSGRRSSAPRVQMTDEEAAAFRRAPVAAMADGPTLATAAAGLKALAKADIRDLPPRPIEPFRCHRCLDTRTVPDWDNWQPAWLWQRYRPVLHIPCPDCIDRSGT